MPELAEVAFYARQWDPVIGQRIESAYIDKTSRVLRENKTLSKDTFTGRRFIAYHLHGKQMLFEFEGAGWLRLHLGMTGKLRTEPTSESSTYQPRPHDRLVLYTQPCIATFNDARHFGRITWLDSVDTPTFWTALPPAVNSKDFTEEITENALKRRPKTAIKTLLLDQAYFPGVGNWMADEILWRAKIHPASRSGSLNGFKARALYNKIVEVAHDSMRVIAQDWSTPPDEWLFNHRWKDGGICPKSGAPLLREKINGRTACWSPAIQKII
ncbi:MAG: Fpg/Nei family DNA glycosylase [Opitutales bacterium]|nr:Fpg/Nei family DNA glycosylase [Opitutales bacterium]NRA27321.1 Fpg/Nei family DNA glycosylase [Opitutales bacterium]